MEQQKLDLEIRIGGDELFNNNASISLPSKPLTARIKNLTEENKNDEFDDSFTECIIYPLALISDEVRFKIVDLNTVKERCDKIDIHNKLH